MPHPENYQTTDDQELLANYYRDHDNRWLGILLQRYTLLLLGVCMKYLRDKEEAKDSVQQIFLKAITELEKYRVIYFRAWIYEVARKHCLMQLRKKNLYTTQINEQLMGILDETITKEQKQEQESFLGDMARALQMLNEEQRKCLHLFYLQKKSYQEVAEITGHSMLQVKSHIQNGKRNLRIIMEKMQQHAR